MVSFIGIETLDYTRASNPVEVGNAPAPVYDEMQVVDTIRCSARLTNLPNLLTTGHTVAKLDIELVEVKVGSIDYRPVRNFMNQVYNPSVIVLEPGP